METKHSQKKTKIELKSFQCIRPVILEHFPDLEGKIFENNTVMFSDIIYLIDLCQYNEGHPRVLTNHSFVTRLVNYMVDNKHMYEWWKL